MSRLRQWTIVSQLSGVIDLPVPVRRFGRFGTFLLSEFVRGLYAQEALV